MRAQEPVAETVDRGDPRAVELTGQVRPPALAKRSADARPQLACCLSRVGDDEDRVDVDASVADRAHVALDEHGRLPGPGAGRDEHRALGLDRGELLLVE
jgi:hypothetical protein